MLRTLELLCFAAHDHAHSLAMCTYHVWCFVLCQQGSCARRFTCKRPLKHTWNYGIHIVHTSPTIQWEVWAWGPAHYKLLCGPAAIHKVACFVRTSCVAHRMFAAAVLPLLLQLMRPWCHLMPPGSCCRAATVLAWVVAWAQATVSMVVSGPLVRWPSTGNPARPQSHARALRGRSH